MEYTAALMPTARVDGIGIFYEETGEGAPLVFVHEFAGDYQSWHLQVRFFARRYRTIAYNARGYPPSDVPDKPEAYSQEQAAEDIRGLLDHLRIPKAHICGLSMGGYAMLHFGLRHPERALSLTVAGAGYGSVPGERERFRKDVDETARRFDDRRHRRRGRLLHQGPHPRAVHGQGPEGLAGVLRPVRRPVREGPRAHHAGRADDAAVHLRAGGRDSSGSRCRP